jgi:hypothetical protein
LDSRQQRVGKNETLFREVNERIREITEPQVGTAERSDFICECGHDDCMKPISLTLSEYERVRADPAHFFVVPGHEIVDVERIAYEAEGYVVVEKIGVAGAIAHERDPRS